MRLVRRLTVGLVPLLLSITPLVSLVPAQAEPVEAAPEAADTAVSALATGTVTFAAGGDFGANSNTAKVLQKLDSLGTEFTLALGDFDYDQTPSDAAWCDFVHTNMPASGPQYPFELVVGNHEDDGMRDGYILNFTQCLPDRLGAVTGPGSIYGAEYYVDYPRTDPMVRSIMLAPGLSVEGVDYSYTSGTHRTWLMNAISSARAAGIPWVVVGAHYPCLSTATLTCGMTQPLMRLLVQQKVDLILQGHNHIYERTHQLATGPGCTDLAITTFDADCVVDSGADGQYTKGAGPVVLTVGASGMTLGNSRSDDPQVPYFAKVSTETYGITRFTATPSSLAADFVPADGQANPFRDSFTIGGATGGNEQPIAVFTPTCTSSTCSVDASDSSDPDGNVVSYAWRFGDGATGSGAITSHTYSSAETFTIELTVTDDQGATDTVSHAVTVGSSGDTVAPTVTNRSPVTNATGVARGANVTATFSEPVTGVNTSTMTLRKASSGAAIGAAVSYNATSRVATLNPSNRLAANTRYTVTLTSGITDAAGNALAPASWSFTTSA
jgi:Bacterial Ig-like domain/PKD domain/Calcineurin-like phosphoesterase